MALCTDDGQAPRSLHLLRQLDVGSPTRHIRRDGDRSGLACLGHHLRLRLVALGIEHLVLNFTDVQHAAQQLTDLHCGRAHEHGTSSIPQLDHVVDNRIELLPLRFEDHVVLVLAGDGAVGRNGHHIQCVDVPQFLCLGLRRSSHARKLVVHAEVILQGHRRIGLGGRLDAHPLLRLNGLVESIRVAPALHNPARLLVDNLDLVVHHHIVHVLLEQGVGLEQLVHRV